MTAADWERFVEEITWFVAPGEIVEVGPSTAWSRAAVAGLPRLSALLARAELTSVDVGGRAYELVAWGREDERRGWLCLPPSPDPPGRLHPLHQELLRVWGGIVERFNEPQSRLLNQAEVLTEEAATTDVAATLEDYAWIWEDGGLTLPIEPRDHHAVAVEANGNLTLAHRVTGQILLFAPDHSFAGLTRLPGCPEYSLYTIDDAPDLSAWIEWWAGSVQ